MILQEADAESYGKGMGETTELTMNLDGMMFHNLVSGIYSDKIAAPIRELSTNARDGHAMVNKLDVPFDIHLPTRNEPEFYVRDYGCSMTPHTVKTLYTVVGGSDKRESNEVTGCLGLGSKSPWAYTTSFHVTCWKDGRKVVYAAYKQSNGKPAISEISNHPSKEPTGVKVGFAVKAQDVEAFNTTAARVLIGFNPRPNLITHTSSFAWNERTPIVKGDNYEIYEKDYRAKSYAIQGSVAYPIESTNTNLRTAIQDHPDSEKKKTYPYSYAGIELLENADLRINFEIGKLQNTTSREELAYDKMTCENIANELMKIIAIEKKALNERYKSYKNICEAQLQFSKDADSKTLSQLAKICGISFSAKYNGKELASNYSIEGSSSSDGIKITPRVEYTDLKTPLFFRETYIVDLGRMNGRLTIGENKNAFSTASGRNLKNFSFHKMHEDINYFVEVENIDVKSINNKRRKMWVDEAVKGEVNLWITVPKLSVWKAMQQQLMIKSTNVKFLHDLDDLKAPKKSVKAVAIAAQTVIDLRVISPQRWGTNSQTEYAPLDLANNKDKYPVLYQKGTKFYKNIVDIGITDGYDQTFFQREYDGFRDTFSDDSSLKQFIYVLNTQNQKVQTAHPQHFVQYDEYQKGIVSKYKNMIKDILEESSITSRVGENSYFFDLFVLVDESDLPICLSGVADRRKATTSGGIQKKKVYTYHGDKIKKLEEFFPDEVKAARDALLYTSFLDVDKVMEENPILSIINSRRYYSDKKEVRDAVKQLCKLLKESGK